MNRIWVVLILALILRIFLAASTFHPDTLAFKLGGDLVASGKIFNLYDYSDPKIAILNYPPLIYWFHGFFNFFLAGVLGTTLLVKLPYMIFDFLTAFLIYKIFPSRKDALFALSLWLFNPVSLYATYMMGQFDIIPTFFTILSFYYVSKNRLSLAALALGGGIAFKIYPVFLLIPLLVLGKNLTEKIKLFIFSLLPYLLSVSPYLSSHSFRSTALFASQSSKSLYASIPVSGAESILLFPVTLLLFYLLLKTRRFEKVFFWKLYLVPLLLFFVFTHFHPQWLIWVTPFLVLDLVTRRFNNLIPIILIILSWFGSLFFFDSSLTVGMFAPLFPILKTTPAIWTILNLNIDYNLGRSLLQTFLVAASFYLIYHHFLKHDNA